MIPGLGSASWPLSNRPCATPDACTAPCRPQSGRHHTPNPQGQSNQRPPLGVPVLHPTPHCAHECAHGALPYRAGAHGTTSRGASTTPDAAAGGERQLARSQVVRTLRGFCAEALNGETYPSCLPARSLRRPHAHGVLPPHAAGKKSHQATEASRTARHDHHHMYEPCTCTCR